MNVLFAGYRSWAYTILENILKEKADSWKIKAIITTGQPEASFTSFGLPIIQFDPQNASSFHEAIASYSPDLILFYGWSWIISKEIHEKYLCLALHTSPLPKYRGGSPLQHQIMAGETESAISLFKIDKGLDTGPLYAQAPFSLEGSMTDIFGHIVEVGTKETIRVLNTFKNIHPIPQDDKNATVYRRRTPEQSELTIADLQNKTSKELYNFIRALEDPYPNAYIVCKDGKKVFFPKAKYQE